MNKLMKIVKGRLGRGKRPVVGERIFPIQAIDIPRLVNRMAGKRRCKRGKMIGSMLMSENNTGQYGRIQTAA